MLQADEPDDYVIATGETHTVREFCEKSFACAGITLAWEGEGVAEVGRCTKTGKVLVGVDPHYFRPAEVDLLLGDPSKAKKHLDWEPKVTFEGLVRMMTRADLDLAASESGPRTQG
jgi:GDPmannose 4,6-dehydratase